MGRVETRARHRLTATAHVVVPIAFIVLCAVLSLFRQMGTHSWNSLWAEDGSIYIAQARSAGAHSLFRGYAGYLQLPPRLLGMFGSLLPVRWWALYCSFAAIAVAALLALFMYRACEDWITSRPARLVLAAFLLLMPVAGRENTANITNTIWVFLAVTPLAFLTQRNDRRFVAARAMVVFFGATSSAIALLYAPLACVVTWARRSWSSATVFAAYAVGALLQIAVVTHTTGRPVQAHQSAAELFKALGTRVSEMYLFGVHGTVALRPHGIAILVASSLILLGVIALLAWHASPRAVLIAGALVVYAVVTFSVPAWGRGVSWLRFRPPSGFSYQSFRFSVVPCFLLASALAGLFARSRFEQRWRRAAVAVFALHLVVLMGINFSVSSYRSVSPDWTTALSKTYATECHGRGHERVLVKSDFFGHFTVPMTCEELRRATGGLVAPRPAVPNI